jgi:hypothetical protein
MHWINILLLYCILVSSFSRAILRLYGTELFITVFTRAHTWNLRFSSEMIPVHILIPRLFGNLILFSCEPCSSVSIISLYGLNDRVIYIFDPWHRRKDFYSNLCVQTGSGAHPDPVQWVPGVLSPGLKRGRGAKLTTHPNIVPRSKMSRSYSSSPPSAFVACSGTALANTIYLSASMPLT